MLLSIDNRRMVPSGQHRATMPHLRPLEVDIPTITPERALLQHANDPVAQVAALYPHDTISAQHLLAQTAADCLREAGRRAALGSYGPHATIEVPERGRCLVVVPMADLTDLDAELAIEDDRDPAVWHVLVRDGSGSLLEPGVGGLSCPSVIWALSVGIDPAAAVALVDAALADPVIAALLGGRS